MEFILTVLLSIIFSIEFFSFSYLFIFLFHFLIILFNSSVFVCRINSYLYVRALNILSCVSTLHPIAFIAFFVLPAFIIFMIDFGMYSLMYCNSDGVKQFIILRFGIGKFIELLIKSSLFFTEIYSGIHVLFVPKISVKYFNFE